MSARYLGGVIAQTQLPLNPAAGNAANGVFTLNQYMQAVKNATWPGFDPYFKQNVLLLHGNGTNGAQNNTFLDSSTNNFTITRNGNTTQGTFSPFSGPNGYWGNYFGGDGNYLSVPYNAAFDFGTGDFTMECFVWAIDAGRSVDATKYGTIFSGAANLSTLAVWSGGIIISGGVITTVFFDANNVNLLTASGQNIPINAWHHFVFCRTGTTLSIFVDGTRIATTTSSASINTNSSGTVQIARNAYGGLYVNWLLGYFANARIIKGSGPYDATQTTLTVPTAPLTNITNTSLLTCQSNRFVDNSTNAFTVTAVGSPSVTPFSPFAPTAAYSAGTNGGSGYFDGTGDYLSAASNAAFALPGAFTFECWFYPITFDQTATRGDTIFTAITNGAFLFGRTSGGVGNFWGIAEAGIAWRLTTATLPTNRAWNHMVGVRDGSNNTALFLNGVRVASGTITTSFTQSGFTIGSDNNQADSYLDGYLANVRLVKGTAVYDPTQTTLTVPTAQLTAISGTSLLCDFTNAGIIDNTGKNNLETVGNAQIDTAVKKFGDGSLEFDGTGDYLITQANPLLALGTEPFTVEFWAYPRTTSDNDGVFTFGGSSSGLAVSIFSNTWNATTAGSGGTAMGAATPNAWIHIALVRETNGGVIKFYKNGVYENQLANANLTDNQLKIGYYFSSSFAYDGFIDDFRITKGVARYTSNFAVPYLPQGPLPLVGGPYIPNTVLMLPGTGTNGAQNNTFLDSSTNNFTITRNGNTTQGTFSPFSRANGYWGNYFDGTGDYLAINFSSGSTIAGDFTWECFAYDLGTKPYGTLVGWRSGSSGWSGFLVQRNNGPNLVFYINNGTTITQTSGTYVSNAWNHIAVTRSGTTVTLWVNGVSCGTASVSGSFNPSSNYWIGSDPFNNVSDVQFGGYISNQRFVNGTALYTGTFTPPTAPLTAISGTSLLTCQSNRFIDNSTNNFTITRNGDVKIVTFSPFEYLTAYSPTTNGGSGYFDGSGDYLTTPSSTTLAVGSGDFTIECWIYMTARGTYGNYIVDFRNGNILFLSTDASDRFQYYNGAFTESATGVIKLNQWQHICVVRNGAGTNNVKGYVDGVQVLQLTDTTDYGTANVVTIGSRFNGSDFFYGYMSNFRIVKGTAVYTSNFTPPTAPLTAIANTSLLCNFTNAGIYDASMSNDLETVGNAQVSTTQSKWGGGSMYFDGSGDYLVSPHVADFEFGSGNFTIEFWAYANAISGAYTGVVGVWQGGASATANSWLVLLNCFNATNKFGFSYSNGSAAVDYVFDATTTTGSWNHYMVVRSGNTLYGFKNGVLLGFSSGTSAISGSITNGTQPLYIGTGGTASSGTDFNGYISDLRILKGVAILPTPLQTSQWQDQ